MGSLFKSKIVLVCCFLFIAMIGGVVFLFFTDEGVATEFRQFQQAKPNLFYIGIDVSATIDADILNDFKENVISRLKMFIGDDAVSYHISTFGNPGCGKRSIQSIVSMQSPKEQSDFTYKVEKKIQKISAVETALPGRPLTTPLYCLLENVLTKQPGGRIIIFSDLMNDDSECPKQYTFPESIIKKFGENKDGQIIFIYPTPQLTSTPEFNERIIQRQQDFITKMQKLASEGNVRAFFYHIPDSPRKKANFMKSQLQKSIPATTFDIVWERAYRVIDTIVSAVRG